MISALQNWSDTVFPPEALSGSNSEKVSGKNASSLGMIVAMVASIVIGLGGFIFLYRSDKTKELLNMITPKEGILNSASKWWNGLTTKNKCANGVKDDETPPAIADTNNAAQQHHRYNRYAMH